MDDFISLLKSHIITYVSPLEISESQSNSLTFILDKIKSKELNLKGLIELLGNELTNENDLRRSRGMSLLSAALRTCLDHQFNITFDKATENAIITFLIQRLDDYHTQKECIECLHAIVSSRETLEAINNPDQIVKGIFCSERLHVQSLPQSIRRKVYEILSFLLETHQSKLLELKEDLVFGFIQAMDGEKDPRNLILCFELFVNIVLNSKECSKFEEDLFEITSCYFPITFTEKPQSNIGIKKIDLVQGLRRTMVASPGFWIPFLLEKLTSSIVETKLEVLSYLNFAFSDMDTCNGKTIWNFNEIEEKIPILRDTISNEILQSTDNVVQTSGLQCIASLTRWISNSGKDHLLSFLKPLIDKGIANLSEKYDTKIMSVTSKILQACTAASDASSNIIIPTLFPLLLEKYRSEKDDVQKLCLVRMIVNFTKSTVKINKENPDDHPLKQFYPQFIEEFIITANTSTFQPQERADAIDLLSTLLTLNRGQLAKESEILNIIDLFVSILLYHGPYNSMYNIDTYNSIRLASLQAIVNIIYFHSKLLISHALPRIFKEFELRINKEIEGSPEELSVETKVILPPTIEEIVSWIRALCDPNSIEMVYSIPSMVISRHESNLDVQDNEILNTAIQKYLIHLLNKYYNHPKVMSNLALILSEIIKSESSLLIILNILLAKYRSGIELIYINNSIPELVYNVVHTLDHQEQALMLSRFYNAFINNKLDDIIVIKEGSGDEIIEELIKQDPTIIQALNSLSISPFKNYNDRKFVIFYASLFGGCSIHEYNEDILQNVVSILTDSIKLLYNCIVYPLESDNDKMDVETSNDTYISDTDIICRGLESLINKFIKKEPQFFYESISKFILDDLKKLLQEIDEKKIQDSLRIESIHKILVSFTKALIRKNIPVRDNYWDILTERLFQEIRTDEEFEQKKILSNMFKGLFRAERHLPVTSTLFKQKYFLKFLSRITTLFNESTSNSKQQYILLISLTGLLNEIPKAVLVETAETIVPLLLDSIKSDYPELKQETISTISKLSELSPAIIEPRLSTVINIMLEMSSDKTKANMKTRAEAIKCLLTLHKYPYRLIQPYKELVINGLNKSLDDPKRIVRQIAVKCKNKWIMLNQK